MSDTKKPEGSLEPTDALNADQLDDVVGGTRKAEREIAKPETVRH